MAEPLDSPLPRVDLSPGMVIQFEAIDPTTGATVSSVTVSDIAIFAGGDNVGEGAFSLGPFMLVPGPGA